MNVPPSSIATSLGIGSGIDMAGLAVQLAEAQFAGRNERLTAKSETLERQISLAGSIRSSFSVFANALGDRMRTGDLAPIPTISNSSIASVSSPLGSLGKGSYTLEVLALASSQTLTGPVYGSGSDSVGAGTLTIRFGATTNNGFTENAARPALALEIAPGTSLAGVANAINAQNAGLSAYVAQTAAGAQLVVKGAEGVENGFVLEASEDGANPGLAALAWQPGGDPTRLVKSSADAEYLLDGLLRRSSSNTIPNAAPSLSLSLTGTNAGMPATIGFASSNGAIGGLMQDVTSALNEIVAELRTATNPLGGELARDPGARALSRSLSALGSVVIMPNAPAGSPRTLAELGLSIERDGSFRFDEAKLTQALNRDPAGVAAMFTTGINGIYSTIDRLARSSSVSTDPGSLAGSIVRYQGQSQRISSDLTKLAEQRERLRASMVARFAQSDSRVAASQSTLTFLQSQIDVWNAQRN